MNNNGIKEEIENILTNMSLEMPDAALPEPANVTYFKLEQDRKIYLDYDVCPDVIEIHKMILRWNMEDKGVPKAERKPITLYIDSYGGNIDYMWMMIDTIMTSETPVYTVNVGTAASAAGLIFMAGEKRFMMPRAKVIIHEGSATIAGDAVKVMDESEDYKQSLAQMKEFILSRTKIDKKALNKKRYNDWTIDSKYCLENGVCDVVVNSIDEII